MWRQIKDYPNYEINTNGNVRNLLTGNDLKYRRMNSIKYVTIKHNGSFKHVSVNDLINSTFSTKEIFTNVDDMDIDKQQDIFDNLSDQEIESKIDSILCVENHFKVITND